MEIALLVTQLITTFAKLLTKEDGILSAIEFLKRQAVLSAEEAADMKNRHQTAMRNDPAWQPREINEPTETN